MEIPAGLILRRIEGSFPYQAHNFRLKTILLIDYYTA